MPSQISLEGRAFVTCRRGGRECRLELIKVESVMIVNNNRREEWRTDREMQGIANDAMGSWREGENREK